MTDSLSAVLRLLQSAGIDVDAETALDAVWLALRMREKSATDENIRRLTPSSTPSVRRSGSGSVIGTDEIGDRFSGEVRLGKTGEYPVPVATQTASAEGRAVTFARAPALADTRGLIKAFRPLRRRVVTPGSGLLDIEATVQRAAEEDLWMPSFEPARERWLDVLLVADHGLSMIIWKDTIDEFERVLRNSGAFRTVRSWWLESDAKDLAVSAWGRGPKPATPEALTQLVRGTSRSVIFVISDCVGARWHDGGIPKLLAQWSKRVPTALLQVTPEWFWARTALGDTVDSRFRTSVPAVVNRQFAWDTAALGPGSIPREIEKSLFRIPVASLTSDAVGRVADLVAGVGRDWTPGVVFDLTWNGDGEAAPASEIPAEERVTRFLALASDAAKRLASAYAASPVRTLDVLRRLRRDLLPNASPFTEAEVVLGGLVRVRREDARWNLGTSLPLEFCPGVQPLVLDGAVAGDVVRALTHAAAVAASGVGPTFTAWLENPSSGMAQLDPQASAFAAAAADALTRLGGSYARIVKPATAPPPSESDETIPTPPEPESAPASAISWRFWELGFDQHGGPDVSPSSIISAVQSHDIVDLVVLVHGWNLDRPVARERYQSFLANMQRTRAPVPGRVGAISVFWPSAQWSEDDETRRELREPPAYSRVMKQNAESGPDEEQLAHATSSVNANPDDPEAREQLEHLVQNVEAQPKRRGLFGSIIDGAKSALRTATYWQMKKRAGVVGRAGLGIFLDQLAHALPTVRVHLVAHSLGARLASHAVHAIPRDSASRVKSLTLIQGVMSRNAFAKGTGTTPPGALADVVDRVDGPIVVTHSRDDSAVRIAVDMAERIAGADEDAPGESPSSRGALGRDGAQDAFASTVQLGPVGTAYSFRTGIVNVDASGIITLHSGYDVPEVAWLVRAAAGIDRKSISGSGGVHIR